jgi:hypothetical protein
MAVEKRHVARRGFLQVGTAGILGLSLPSVLHAEATETTPLAKAKNVVMIWLSGGPATIDMWDPKPDAPDFIRGEFNTIETSVSGVRIGEHMPETAKIMNRATLVRSTTWTTITLLMGCRHSSGKPLNS